MASTDRIQGVLTAKAIKTPARAATEANITLEGLQTIDGVVLADGDRVLVKDQTDATQNGIYDAGIGAWKRSLDFNNDNEITNGTLVYITDGTNNGGLEYRQVTDDPVLGTSNITFQATALLPGGSVDEELVRFDGTTGKLLQGSGVTVSDSGRMTITNFNPQFEMDDTDVDGLFRMRYNGTTFFVQVDPDNVAASSDMRVQIDGVSVLRIDADGDMCIGASDPNRALRIDKNSSIKIPVGTTSQRPGVPIEGDLRRNSETGQWEGYSGTAWENLIGAGLYKGENGEVGASAGDIFRINEATLNTNVTIDADENASCTGPLTVANGVTLTVNGELAIL